MSPSPHPESARIKSTLSASAAFLRPWSGTGYRFVSARYGDPSSFLSGEGALRHGSRWLPPGVSEAVHLSDTPEHAIAEALARHRREAIPDWQAMPLLVGGVSVDVHALLDLGSNEVLAALSIGKKDLTALDWRKDNWEGRESLTQAIGRGALDAESVEGLLVPSAVLEESFSIVLFLRRLRPGSRLALRLGTV